MYAQKLHKNISSYIQKLVIVQKYIHLGQKIFYIREIVRTLHNFCASFCLHLNMHKKTLLKNLKLSNSITKNTQKLRNCLKTGTKTCIKKLYVEIKINFYLPLSLPIIYYVGSILFNFGSI